MAANTNIEWTSSKNPDGSITRGKSWNPIRGCSRISRGCTRCYAERVAARFSKPGLAFEGLAEMINKKPRWTGKIRLLENSIEQPFSWKTSARVFVNSMSDLWHEEIPFEFIDEIFLTMALADWHTYLILTKRADRMKEYFQWVESRWTKEDELYLGKDNKSAALLRSSWPLSNVWIGVSVEDQEAADSRIPFLLEIPATVRFLSCEPLLGPLDLSAYLSPRIPVTDPLLDAPDGAELNGMVRASDYWERVNSLHWIIAGGESGPEARPMQPDWARSLRDQAKEAGVSFFFKQWGQYGLVSLESSRGYETAWRDNLSGQYLVSRGKKAAGRKLDDQFWDEMPQAPKSF